MTRAPRSSVAGAHPGPGPVNAAGLDGLSSSATAEGDTIDGERGDADARAVREWVDAARRGDGAAFDRVARHYLPAVRRWALVRTADPDDADDVVQRSLLHAYDRIGTLRNAGAFPAWLYRITANAAARTARKARSRRRAMERVRARATLESPASTDAADAGDPADGVTALVRSFMDDLSDRQRAMMDLVDLQGMTPAQAAATLGLSDSTARVHLLRARRRIRARLLEARPSVVEDLR